MPTSSILSRVLTTMVVMVALVVPASAQAAQDTVFPPGSGPAGSYDDGGPLTVGMAWSPSVGGTVTAIRFWKPAGDPGVHIGKLWAIDGTDLGTIAFTGETASGWQQAQLATPIAVSAGAQYVVGVHTSAGRYGASLRALELGYSYNHALAALAPSASPLNGNGLFSAGGVPTFPVTDFGANHNNYFVDVVLDHAPIVSPPRPGVHGSGPVLVGTGPDDPHSEYLTDILTAEGIPQHAWTDAANIGNAVSLQGYETVILANTPVGPTQVAALTAFVQGGGTLVATHPDPSLDGLLGVTRTGLEQAAGYLKVDTSSQPGTGIAGETMQYHGASEQLTALAGTRVVAALYADRSTSTPFAAITMRPVGSGIAAAIAYDLPASIIATRQGNLAWEGENRDAQGGPPRTADFFVGDSSTWTGLPVADPQPDWVDFQRIQIPQADEQQRLLVKLLDAAPHAAPVPRLWYLPRKLRAALVLTGDGHANVHVQARIDRLDDLSPSNCSLVDWQCVRGTFYVWNNHIENGGGPVTSAAASSMSARGFEWALHHDTDCQPRSDDAFEHDATWGLTAQLATFQASYPGVPVQQTMRTHCVSQQGWVDTQKIGRRHGIRFNLDSYLWPKEWIADRPALMTGSAFPMKLTDRDGSRIDVWSANTEITDESGQSLRATTATLLDNATDPTKQYFGAFVANMHFDDYAEAEAQTVVSAAKARGVPIITAQQMLDWTDTRAATTLDHTTWDGTTLGFDVTTAAHDLTVLVPAQVDGKELTKVQRCDGTVITADTSTIKGVGEAFVPVSTGRYAVAYGTLASDLQLACTGVAGSTTGGGGGGGSVTGGTTDTRQERGVQPAVPVFESRTILRILPAMTDATCGTSLRSPCVMEPGAHGLHVTVHALTAAASPAGQHATVLVDRRLPDGRWRHVSRASTPIRGADVVVTWHAPSSSAAGVYRMRVAFPAFADLPAGTSAASYLRMVPERFVARTTLRQLASRDPLTCGRQLARPCVLGQDELGVRIEVLPDTSFARPAAQRARFTVDRLLPDGRWRRASAAVVRIHDGGVAVDWGIAGVRRIGVYRMRAAFPKLGGHPAGQSAYSYLRIRSGAVARSLGDLRRMLVVSSWGR